MSTSSVGCYGAASGPVTITAHGSGSDLVLPLITLSAVPSSGEALEAHARACLSELNLLADDAQTALDR
ncbi:hypothetical protein MTY66_61960 (plasmid) [Mycolicibacterium sp. TY66]|uniref:hypothetical protein n=1 Tax=unclassified Mycolicibacterium TaxID=2636767 RepID=UPI001BB2F250|nr:MULTISPECIES: hypothetical protein [unclassified Mycolicibacterium]BCI84571.1 hypothetical protein MTY66_61960 [Mycolicibacterium sp. TY66]BCJ84801.1 hypothetical protein MTY81_61740 [Mycolicibacterium sp. TY81]